MKKYIDPQAEIVCLTTADVITGSESIKEAIFTIVGGAADFDSTSYGIDDGFWG